MQHLARSIALAIIALGVVTARSPAQQTETPLAFDSAGKVRSITPALVTRFHLAPPVWPVTGDFVEARLFQISSGGRVVTVERRTGAVERYAMSDEEAFAIIQAVDAGLTRLKPTDSAPRTAVLSAPAGGTFARNQMALTWILYGPLLASIANDGKTGTALYLLATGASYFITSGMSKKMSVTRAQNHLASDGAFRGWGVAAGLLYSSSADVGQKAYSGFGLAGAVGGAIAGFKYGRGLTDAEAQAASAFSTFSALTALGLTVTAGVSGDRDEGKVAIGTAVGAGLVGYLQGPNYTRKSRYNVTRGDVQLLTIGALLGTMTAVTPIVGSDVDEKVGFGVATAGMLTGLLVADRALVRPYDHSSSEASQIWLGTLAGGLMGSAIAVLIEPAAAGAMALVTAGAIAGTLAGHALANPARATQQSRVTPSFERSVGGLRLELNPASALMSAARVPGRHALVTLTF